MNLLPRIAIPVALLAVSGLAFSFHTQQPVGQQGGPQQKGKPEGGGPGGGPGGGDLEKLMKGMKGQMKALMAGVEDPTKNEASLAAIVELERLVLESKKLEPTNLAEIAAEKRDQHLLDFRRDLAKLLGEFTAVEVDVLEGKNADAKGKLENTVLAMREDGHEKFQPKEGKRKRGPGGPGGGPPGGGPPR